jgi:hypothetical protein
VDRAVHLVQGIFCPWSRHEGQHQDKAAKEDCRLGIYVFINLWMRIGIFNVLNKTARKYDVEGFPSIFDYWRGDLNLVAEPAEFTDAKLPPNHIFIGPLIARQDFPILQEVQNLPHDKLLIS